MSKITSVLISFADSNGSEALEFFDLEPILENAVPPIRVVAVAFYEKGDDGVSRKLESSISNRITGTQMERRNDAK